jgi:hypothetical protein
VKERLEHPQSSCTVSLESGKRWKGRGEACIQGSCSYSREFKLFSIVRGRFYIPKIYRRIELRVQGGFPQKIDFSEIA